MPKVLKTPQGSTAAVEVVGLGLAHPGGKGGIPLAGAADVCSELQTPGAAPLEGDELLAAAEAFASARGLELVDVDDDSAGALAIDAGTIPPLTPAAELAVEEYQKAYGGPAEPVAEIAAPVAETPAEPEPTPDPEPTPARRTGSGKTQKEGEA